MKNFIVFLLLASPFGLFGQQYMTFPTSYDSEGTAKQICTGSVEKFLSDTIEWKVEKKNDRWVTSWINLNQAESKLNQIFSKGVPKYTSSTNAGYWFYISVEDPSDDTRILRTVKFEVDHYTQKIKTIEVYLQEK